MNLPEAMTQYQRAFCTSLQVSLAGRSLLQATIATPMAAGTTALVVPPYPAALNLASAAQALTAAHTTQPDFEGVGISDLAGISMQGIAGNGLCEVGEMPTADGANAGEHARHRQQPVGTRCNVHCWLCSLTATA